MHRHLSFLSYGTSVRHVDDNAYLDSADAAHAVALVSGVDVHASDGGEISQALGIPADLRIARAEVSSKDERLKGFWRQVVKRL